jgi:general secretion pathway protein G
MKRKTGFTLIELLAVMAIVGILAGLVLGISSYASRKASESRAIADMERLKTAIEEYKIEFGAYPEDSSWGATALQRALSNHVSDIVFEDPWGVAYTYTKDNDFSFVIESYGPDMEAGGGDDLSTAKGYQ